MGLTSRTWWGIVLIIVGFLFIMEEQAGWQVSDMFLHLWPLLLVAVGIRLVLRQREKNADAAPADPPLADIGIGQREEEVGDTRAKTATLLGNAGARIVSRTFQGGSVSTVIGNARADLSAAALAPGEHMLKVDTITGSVLITVPPGMAVNITADAVIGSVHVFGRKRSGFFPSVSHASDGYRDTPHRLRLDLSTVFGDVHVTRNGE